MIRATWLSWVQHRGFFFLLAFGWMIPPLIYLFVWSTAAGAGTVGGFTRGQFVAYYLVLIMVNQLPYSQTNWTVGDIIRYGGMNQLLLRPLSPFFDTLSSEVAGKVVYMLFAIPATGLLALVLRPEAEITTVNALAFVPVVLMAWALRFLWGYALALLALLDLVLGLGVLVAAALRLGATLTLVDVIAFLASLLAGLVILYAILLAFAGLVFWSPGFLFTWLFDAFFQMARYPVGRYPGWLRPVLTWVVPVGVMTTVPAQALSGDLSVGVLVGSLALAGVLFGAATWLFRTGLRRYASASS